MPRMRVPQRACPAVVLKFAVPFENCCGPRIFVRGDSLAASADKARTEKSLVAVYV